MGLGRRATALLTAVVGALGAVQLGAIAAGATAAPTAELSINPAANALSATFVAGSTGFPDQVVSYKWVFGDGKTASTSTGAVVHTYAKAGRFSPTVTERDGTGHQATAKGTISLITCPVGVARCTATLRSAGTVALLQASGAIRTAAAATVNLFVGPFLIARCSPVIAPAVAVTDLGFSGNLTVMLKYTTSQPSLVRTTCFASTVAFVDTAGRRVHSGALPTCQTKPMAPCVKSVSTSGSSVTKVLFMPPGDPKVGAP
jgi:hypothetical protein